MKRRAEEPKSSGSWTAAIVAALLVACLLAAGAWWLWPQSSLVPKTASMAKGLLDAGGKPDRQAIRQLMTNVDQMPRDELFQLWLVTHFMLVRRTIGVDRTVQALDGYPTKALEVRMKKPLFPDLWDVRVRMTRDWDRDGGVPPGAPRKPTTE